MAFIDEVIDKAQKAGKFVCDKAVDAKDYVSLEYKASTLRSKTEGLYRELGRLVYTNDSTGNDIEASKQELICKIRALIEEQNEINLQITKFKNICTSCGAANPSKADYCTKCGKELR